MTNTEEYAQAVWNLAHKDGADVSAVVKNLVANLKSHGKLKLLPGILQNLHRLEERNAKLAPMVEVAHAGDSAQALKEAAAHGIHAKHAQVNPSLIKGWRASSNGKLVDSSAKRSLIDLYKKVVTP
jgi:F0F1-type ATP synthase delta subunit